MSNSISVVYRQKGVTQNSYTVQSLTDVIKTVKSTELKDLVNQIKSLSNSASEEAVKDLKKTLPAFYPTLSALEPVTPTGIIQFDIDSKDNQDLNMDELLENIKNHPSTIFVFKSPRNGLKFGILTDFKEGRNERQTELKQRFKYCYELVLSSLLDINEIPNFKDDGSCNRLNQACYLSFDSNAFVNENAELLVINDSSKEIISLQKYPNLHTKGSQSSCSPDFVKELLSYIPPTYSYDDRRPINYAVCKVLGLEEGIQLLIYHWQKDHKKTERVIRSQMKYLRDSNIGVLINEAKKNGYVRVNPPARNKILPKLSSIKLPPILTPEEGKQKLESIIDDFFTNRKNAYVAISVGAGKTKSIIDKLADPSMSNKKVLLLVKDHRLAMQIENDLRIEIKKRKSSLSGFNPEYFKYKNNVVRIKGKDRPIRIEDELLSIESPDEYKKIESQILKMDYFGKLPHENKITNTCNYTEQFENKANVRIMTHNEWFNNPSAWSNGVEYIIEKTFVDPEGEIREVCSIKPSDKVNVWKADYVVIDEDITDIDKEINRSEESESDSNFNSIKIIIRSLNSGLSLLDSLKCIQIQNQIKQDDKLNFKTTGSGKYIKSNPKYSEILKCLALYIATQDKYCLSGIYFENGKIKVNRLKQITERYRNTPTLILDATANESVIQQVYPNYEYTKLNIKSNIDVNLYQLCNENFIKSFLQKNNNLTTVIDGLKKIVGQYKNVGLITYQNLEGMENFYRYLADSLNIKVCTYFGKLRGLNMFENVDCLLIVGRHNLDSGQFNKLAKAIYNNIEFSSYDKVDIDKLVRMKSGEAYSLINTEYEDSRLQAIYEHKNISETIQAVGRGRPIYGKKKDIYLFSKESLGIDLEVTDFFKYEDYFYEKIINSSTLEYLHSLGTISIENKKLEQYFIDAGVTEKINVKYLKKEILNELKESGFVEHVSKSKCLVSTLVKNDTHTDMAIQ